MEASSVAEIPVGAEWQYEPKWDGFRCLLSRTARGVTLTSKSGRPLTRYFPEIARQAAALAEPSFVLDGELLVPVRKQFSFDALLQRIHPAPSRIERLSLETPALFVAFDILKLGGEQLRKAHLPKRRQALETVAKRCFRDTLFRLSPASTKIEDARRWLMSAGEGSDGVIAKRLDLPYQAGNREGMQKIKWHRTADCVVGGFRYGKRRVARRRVVGSLLLGLHDEKRILHHVGFTSALAEEEKPDLTRRLEALVADRSFTGSTPGGPSRWSTLRSSEWVPVAPKLVVEISYDHFTGGRFRHGTAIIRWRPDKKPEQCTMTQLDQKNAAIAARIA